MSYEVVVSNGAHLTETDENQLLFVTESENRSDVAYKAGVVFICEDDLFTVYEEEDGTIYFFLREDLLDADDIAVVYRENQEDKTEKHSQNESLFISNKPTEMEGYAFVGWYTEDGKLVEYIAKGNAENYILYAKREAIRYSITYVDTPINNNVKTYTIEDEVQLTDPEWIGLSFKNWTNAENEVVTKINRGTIGNITLRANWLSEENLATPTDDNKPEGVVFDETLNRYYFIYEMGVIDNIVIGIVESQDKSTMESLTFSKSNTIYNSLYFSL